MATDDEDVGCVFFFPDVKNCTLLGYPSDLPEICLKILIGSIFGRFANWNRSKGLTVQPKSSHWDGAFQDYNWEGYLERPSHDGSFEKALILSSADLFAGPWTL